MDEGRRDLGGEVLGVVPWGTHMCEFYRSKEDMLDLLIPYFKAGIESNEFCMWVTYEPLDSNEAARAMEEAVQDFGRYVDGGQIEIVPHTQWYIREGHFDGTKVLDAWVEKHDQAISLGYEGIRVTGNCSFIGNDDWPRFSIYEDDINDTLNDLNMLVLCGYSLRRCSDSQIEDLVSKHDISFVRRAGDWDIIMANDGEALTRLRQDKRIEGLLEKLDSEGAFKDKVAESVFETEETLQGRTIFPGCPPLLELNRRIGDEIEASTGMKLDSLLEGEHDVQSFAENLVDLHRAMSGAQQSMAKTNARRIVMEVEGCPRLHACMQGTPSGLGYGCLTNMIIAAIIQRAMQTPVKVAAELGTTICKTTFAPAWFNYAMPNLDEIGVDGFVLICNDRVVLSHLPSKAAAEALNESVLLYEEDRDTFDSMTLREVTVGDAMVITSKKRNISMSVLPRHGSDMDVIREIIAQTIRRAISAR